LIATLIILAVLLLVVGALALRRAREIRDRDIAWAGLAAKTPWQAPPFAPSMLEGLPEPARRFLAAAIRPGTPLRPVVELRLAGTLAGSPFGAERRVRGYAMLAPPFGAALRLYPEPNPLGMSGALIADGAGSRARFWLLGFVPLRAVPDAQAAGRLLVETVLWCPAALLPGGGAAWEAVDVDTARVSMKVGEALHQVEIGVAGDGRLVSVRTAGLVATPTEFRDFDGISLPATVRFEGDATAQTPRLTEARIGHVRFIGPWPGSRRS
jgi:hypothetical protein